MKRTMMSLSLAFALAGGALAQGAMTEGEVRKVDAAAGKITLKHGEIKSLDMPPMTMVFRVKDPALLGKVQAGDRVKFAAEKIDGQYTVTSIAKTP
jgi:Cu(I)/Ag(I) efflux system periplasmic protein CusF